MNYAEIKALAISYSDRNDVEIAANIDSFIRVAESRINRVLKTQKMETRISIPTIAEQEYYDLPENFGGLRAIEIRATNDDRTRYTLAYISPEQMNNRSSHSDDGTYKIYYTIIANQIQIMPPQDDKIMELVYYKLITALDSTNTENWISTTYPDLYLFGILVEITSFVKDETAAGLWNSRFTSTLDEITLDDDKVSWSGTSLQARIG